MADFLTYNKATTEGRPVTTGRTAFTISQLMNRGFTMANFERIGIWGLYNYETTPPYDEGPIRRHTLRIGRRKWTDAQRT